MNGGLWLTEFVLWCLELPLRGRHRIRRKLLLTGLGGVGSNFIFNPLSSTFSEPEKIKIGNNVFMNRNTYLGGDISIGDNVMFGPNVTLVAGDHIFAVQGKIPRHIRPFPGQNSAPIVIEAEVWVGAGVIILGGVTIGTGSVVGAGSVVVRDICPYTVSVGNPCRPVRRIFDDRSLYLHLQEIGYDAIGATKIVDQRKRLLAGIDIPVVDRSRTYQAVNYDVAAGS